MQSGRGAEHRSPRHHYRLAVEAARGVGIIPSAIAFDQYYDGGDFRAEVHVLGYPSVQRIRIKGHDRHIKLKDGEATTIHALMERVAAGNSPVYTGVWPKTGEEYAFRLAQFTGRLGKEAHDENIVLQVGLQRHPRRAKFIPRLNRTMVLVGPAGMSARIMRRIYLTRFRTEILFEALTSDYSGARPKTIESHVLLFASRMFATCLGAIEWLLCALDRANLPHELPARYDTRKFATRRVIQGTD